MNYKDFKTEDFLKDEFFVEWVITPNQESNHFWGNWLSQYPGKRKEVELAREIVKKIHYKEQYALSSDEYSFMMEKVLYYNESKAPENVRSITFRRRLNVAASVAASVIILVGVFLVTYFNQQNFIPEDSEVVWVSSTTEFGQKKVVTLPDGTKVTLNSGSQIYYPQQFDEDKREVTFKGEAFFEVARNPEKPFLIYTDELTTKVLGTSFNIKSFDDDEEVSVSVVTGKVAVNTKAGQFALLHPNDMGVFHKPSNELNKRNFDIRKLTAWTDGILVFENENLLSIFQKLEKWYGVHFIIKDGVKLKGKYSGEYKKKSLELVLQGLSYTSNFNYQINNKTITIYEKTN